MSRESRSSVSRRQFLQTAAAGAIGLSIGPHFVLGKTAVRKPITRSMGRLHFDVTTLGLGGQASLQWTPADVDPVNIILKAHALGVNYYDTSNAYGPSQTNYGKAFRELHMVPGQPGYKESARRSVFLTTKTGLRFAKGGWNKPGLGNFTNGAQGSHTVDDIKRSLSQMFGDGEGNYPAGSYLDMVLLHSLTSMADVDAAYEGLSKPDPKAENIGALAALLDYRDGSNQTGLNPKEEKLIRHIGFSGHHSAPVMMEMIQRDERNILDGMLVAINANDRLNFNMQYNVIPVAASRNMGLIAMKVFADGAMYTKEARWTRTPNDVVRVVGSETIPSRRLVEYTLTTPGIHTAIIGTGQISDDERTCQLCQNLSAAQTTANALSVSDRRSVEKSANQIKEGKTNYFQVAEFALTAPREAIAESVTRDWKRVALLKWQSAYAGDEPIARYEIWRDQQKLAQIPHYPQTTKQPFVYEDVLKDKATHRYQVKTVDAAGRSVPTEDLVVQSLA